LGHSVFSSTQFLCTRVLCTWQLIDVKTQLAFLIVSHRLSTFFFLAVECKHARSRHRRRCVLLAGFSAATAVRCRSCLASLSGRRRRRRHAIVGWGWCGGCWLGWSSNPAGGGRSGWGRSVDDRTEHWRGRLRRCEDRRLGSISGRSFLVVLLFLLLVLFLVGLGRVLLRQLRQLLLDLFQLQSRHNISQLGLCCNEWLSVKGLTSHSTNNRSFRSLSRQSIALVLTTKNNKTKRYIHQKHKKTEKSALTNLVWYAFYNLQPVNRAGLFLQPCRLYGAFMLEMNQEMHLHVINLTNVSVALYVTWPAM